MTSVHVQRSKSLVHEVTRNHHGCWTAWNL